MTEAQTSNYWISPNALRITLNAMGLKDYIQCSSTSGAVIMCFMRDIDGLDYDAGHNYRRWPLSTAPTFFNSTTHKYVYVAIPRNSAVASNAQLAFPSEKIDIYGYTEKIVPVRDINGNMLDENGNITTDINKAAKTTEPDKQIGDPSYYYIFLQGIISSSVSEGGADQMREWEEGHTLNYGSLSTDQATKEVDGTWWRYLADDDKVEFLKTITNAVIDKLHVIKEFIVDSAAQFKSSVSIGGALSVAGNATINGLLTAYNTIINTIRSANFTGTGMADSGFQITNTWSGTNDSGAVFDYLTIRKKMVIQSLEIKETHFSAGDLAQSCATAEIIRTDYIDDNGNVIGYSEQVVPWKKLGVWFMLRKVLSGNQKLGIFSLRKKIRITLTPQQLNSVKRVRCYFLAEDGDRKIENWWRVNDLARCQTINVVGGTRETYAGKDSYQGNIYWWRKVMAVSANTGEPSYKWADDEGNLYDTQREGTHRYKNYNGARKGETGDYAHTESYGDAVTIDGKKCHWFDVACDFAYEDGSRTNWCDANSDLPAAGDKVVQFGNTEDPDRMNVTVSEINGVGNPDAPSIKIYRGIYTFDPSLSWWGGNARKMKLSPSTGYEFYGPMFKFVQEYGIARVPLMRPEQYWNNVAFQRDDEYRQNYPDYSDDIKNPNGTFKSRADGHTDKRYVRKLYYYDEITHNGSLWIANFAEEYYWRLTQSISGVGVAGDRISDNDYAGLTEEQKATCERVRSYTIQEPSASVTDWKIAVEKGDAGSFKSRAFCRINTDISGITPTGGNYNRPVPVASTVGSETVTWTDGVPQGDAILWSTVCTFYGDGTSSGWSHPAPETDTATLDIEFSPSQTEPNPPSGNTPFSDHSAEGWYDPSALPVGQTMIWRAERKVSNGVYDGEWVVTRIYGEKGDPGVSITKTGETYRYATNNTGVLPAADDPGWSATRPTLQAGYWLFTETTIHWSDNSTTVLYTDERNPNDGVPGQDIIVDGATEMKYAVSDDNTNLPTTWYNYSDIVSSIVPGKWLWSKATTYYRKAGSAAGSHDAGSSANYNVTYIGTNGTSVSYDAQHSSLKYAISSYGVAESGRDYPSDITSWSDSVPNPQKGKFLWTQDVTAYNSGGTIEYTTTYGVSYYGTDGDSVEIDTSRTFIKYCKQTSSQYTGQHPADNQFSTTYPSDLSKGDYLWVLNQLAYVGVANPLKSYSVSMLGTDGTNGDPGADGYTTHFAYATSADGSQNFSTTNFNGATYIGTYRDQNAADSTNYRDYVWTKWKGETGAAGRAIVSVTEYYKATNSNSPMPAPTTDSGWDTDPNLSHLTDKWDQNHIYLWNYEKVEYSSGTQFERTIPQILAIWTKNGANGKGIDSITNYYQVSSSSTPHKRMSDPGYDPSVDGTWDDNPTAPGNGQYLWNYEMITWIMPDGSNTYTYTDVQMIGYAGDIIFEVSAYKAFASAPQNDKPTEINSITSESTDFGNGWYSTPPTNTTNQIYVSKATVQNGTVVGGLRGWSDPVPWSGKNGNSGTDGITVTVSPSAILLTQSETAPYTVNCGVDSTNNPFAVTIMAIRDNLPLALSNASVVSSTKCTGRCSIVDIGYGPSGEQALIVNGAIKAWVRDVNIANQNNNGSFIISFMAGGKLLSVTIPWYANLLGTWKQSVSDGIQTEISNKLQFVDEDGELITIDNYGEFIKGWSENTSILTKTTARVNLFGDLNRGWLYEGDPIAPIRGWFGTENDEESIWSPDVVLQNDVVYCLSFYSGTNIGRLSVYNYAGYIDITSYLTALPSDTYEQNNRYYVLITPSTTTPDNPNVVAITPSANGKYFFNFYDDESQNELVGLPLLEEGVADVNGNILPSASTMQTSTIKQTAEQIDLRITGKLGDTGIHIDGNNRSINLYGDKVTFSDSEGGNTDKIWIDPDDGTLHAVNSILSGFLKKSKTVINQDNLSNYTRSDISTTRVVLDIDKCGSWIELENLSSNMEISLPLLSSDIASYFTEEEKDIIRSFCGTRLQIYNRSNVVVSMDIDSLGGMSQTHASPGRVTIVECKIGKDIHGNEHIYWNEEFYDAVIV